jgi:hypothetical protein
METSTQDSLSKLLGPLVALSKCLWNPVSLSPGVSHPRFALQLSWTKQQTARATGICCAVLVLVLAAISISCAGGAATIATDPPLTFSDASFNGQYAFQFVGSNGVGEAQLAGTFRCDGKGNITSGVEDIISITLGKLTNLPLTGTYSVGSDGRGNATITNSVGVSHLQFVVISADHAFLIQFDDFGTGTGSIERQDSTAFNDSSISGAYVFQFSGISFGGSYVAAGIFTADGRGSLAGAQDQNDANTILNLPLSGTYTVAANGRGTAVLTTSAGTSNFSFYVVSRSELIFIELDVVPFVSGFARAQQGGSFSNSSLFGNYAFAMQGQTINGPYAVAGRLTANGRGGITGGQEDGSDSISITQNLAFTGSYAMSSNGRGTGTLTSSMGSSPVVFYLVSPTQAIIMSTDLALVTIGTADAQQAVSFSDASLQGNFGFLAGLFLDGVEHDMVGRIHADGTGSLTGIEDLNAGFTPIPSVTIGGMYSINSNGRVMGTMTTALGTSNFALYLVSSSKAYLVGLDSGMAQLGVIEKQF